MQLSSYAREVFVTSSPDPPPWFRWYVDLGQLAAVSSVRIVNRCDNPNGKQASLHSITSVLGLYDGI